MVSSYYEHGSLEGNVPYIAFPLDLDVALEVMLSGSLTPWVGFSRWSFSAKNGCCFELHIMSLLFPLFRVVISGHCY